MKPTNTAEIKIAKRKFAVMYLVSIILIAIIFSSFWESSPAYQKKINAENNASTKSINNRSEVSSNLKDFTLNNSLDSCKKIIDNNAQQIIVLQTDLITKKSKISELENQLKQQKPQNNNAADKYVAADAKLKQENHFLSWALSSQTNTSNRLSDENSLLKQNIANLNAQINELRKSNTSQR
ncbi:MAG: hypothetical protein ACR2FN_11135 [Chitinophagaceae bacterium]